MIQNVVVYALIWSGKPFGFLKAAADGDLRLTTSPVLVEGLRGVLTRLHLARRLDAAGPRLNRPLHFMPV